MRIEHWYFGRRTTQVIEMVGITLNHVTKVPSEQAWLMHDEGFSNCHLIWAEKGCISLSHSAGSSDGECWGNFRCTG